MRGSFASQLIAVKEKLERRQKLTFQGAVRDTYLEMIRPQSNGGRMPVLEGWLINSVASFVDGKQIAGPSGVANTSGAASKSAITKAAALATSTSVVRITFNVDHAMRQNYGFVGIDSWGRNYNQQGKFFVEGAMAKWRDNLKKNWEKNK